MAKTNDSKKLPPPRRAKAWHKRIAAQSGRLFLILVATVILGLMFSGLQTIGIFWLAELINAVILGLFLFLFFNEGLSAGVRDTDMSRRMEKLEKEGRMVSAQDDALCYSPVRSVVCAVAVLILPFLLAVIVGLLSKPYTYRLQDLPTWLTQNYSVRSDIMGPLGAYMKPVTLDTVDWLRLVARILGMIFVAFFPDPQKQVFIIDRTLPVLFVLYGCAYVIGYLCGPSRYAKLSKQQRKAKRVAQKKAQRRSLAEELTRQGAEVHYGERTDVVNKEDKNRLV